MDSDLGINSAVFLLILNQLELIIEIEEKLGQLLFLEVPSKYSDTNHITRIYSRYYLERFKGISSCK